MDVDFDKLRRWIVFIAAVVIGMFLGAVEGEAQPRGGNTRQIKVRLAGVKQGSAATPTQALPPTKITSNY